MEASCWQRPTGHGGSQQAGCCPARWQAASFQKDKFQLLCFQPGLQLCTSTFPERHRVHLLDKQGDCRQSSCDSMRIFFFLINDQCSGKQHLMFVFIIPACEIIVAVIHNKRGPVTWWKNFQGQWLIDNNMLFLKTKPHFKSFYMPMYYNHYIYACIHRNYDIVVPWRKSLGNCHLVASLWLGSC